MRPADASEPRRAVFLRRQPPHHTSAKRTPLQSAPRSKAHPAPKRTPLQSADESPIYLPSLIVDSFDVDFFILNQVQALSKIFFTSRSLFWGDRYFGRPLFGFRLSLFLST